MDKRILAVIAIIAVVVIAAAALLLLNSGNGGDKDKTVDMDTRLYIYGNANNDDYLNNDDIMLTAYNTYKGTGLPPGAINNPGKVAIEAVLYPLSPCNDYFFNSNIDTGETFFAETLDQHNANLALVESQYAAAKAAANGET